MNIPDAFTPHSGDGAFFNWQYLWMIGKRHYRLFLWIFAPVVALTILYILIAPSKYESTGVVQVAQREQNPIKSLSDDQRGDDLTSEDAVKTIEQNMQGYDLFEAVAKDPQIATDPNFLVGFSGGDPNSTSDVAEWLQANTKIAIRHGTRLIDISVTHRVPEMAQKLAQSVVSQYIVLGGKAQSSSEMTASKLLSTESNEVKQNLQKSEASLESFKSLLDAKQHIDEQQTLVDGLKGRYRDKHPQMIQARQLLAELEQEFDQDFQKTMANPANADVVLLDPSMATASLDDRVSEELKLVEARSQVLQKEVDTESTLFDNILKQMRESDVSQGSSGTAISMVGTASLPDRPSEPKRLVILGLGLVMGLFLGLSAVAAVHTIEGTINTPTEAESALGVPVLGTILLSPPKKLPEESADPSRPAPPAKPAGTLPDEMVVVTDPGGASAEGFRSLRAVINLLGKKAPLRTTLYTSALPGEGKTFVSCNYALSLAQIGVKTLLVDADLRRPEVHNRFRISNRMGFIECLNQDVPISQVVHAKVAKNLDVLTAGGPCPNPAELLAGPGFKEFLAKALEEYDHIVFDTSPVNLVSDSLLIVSDVDAVCFVIRAGNTSRQAPKHALSQLRRAHKEPAGIVLNAIMPGSDRLYLGYKGKGGTGSYGNVYS